MKDDNGVDVLVPDQIMHCDVNPDDNSLDVDEAFIGIVATQKGITELRVLAERRQLGRQSIYKMPQLVYRIQLPQYLYFVGHPFLIHGGCGSLSRNTRLHFYYGLSEDTQSKTFFVDWELEDVAVKMKCMREEGSAAGKRELKN